MSAASIYDKKGRFIQRTSLGFTGQPYLTGTQKQKAFAFLGKCIFPSFLMYLANTSFSSLPLLNLRWSILTPPFCRKNRLLNVLPSNGNTKNRAVGLPGLYLSLRNRGRCLLGGPGGVSSYDHLRFDAKIMKNSVITKLINETINAKKNMVIVAPAVMAAMMNQNANARKMIDGYHGEEEETQDKIDTTMCTSNQNKNIKPAVKYGWSKEMGK